MVEPEQSSPSPIAVVPETTDDTWLDELTQSTVPRNATGNSWRAPSAELLRKFRAYFQSTPGKMVAICMLLSIAILAAGFSVSQTAAQRRAELDTLTNTTEPVSNAVQEIYSNLSIADTTAISSFVGAGVETSDNRTLYGQAIRTATERLTTTAADLPEDSTEELQLVLDISTLLPTYTGLVETAWANNRQGNPVGAAYMALASSVMQEEILPQAARLHDITSNAVIADQRALTRPMWLPISGMLAAVLFLILAQYWLLQTTRRRLNVGFVCATAFMTIASLWAIATSIVTWTSGTNAYSEAADPLEQLTTARIAAQQIRSQETLALVGRTSLDSGNQSFDAVMEEVTAALDTYGQTDLAREQANSTALLSAYDEANQWAEQHEILTMQLAAGDYDTALETIHLNQPATAGSSFTKLDNALAQLINSTRGSLQDLVAHGSVASAILTHIANLAFVISLAAIWLGIWPRLQEYR